jgi:hypothetical protein
MLTQDVAHRYARILDGSVAAALAAQMLGVSILNTLVTQALNGRVHCESEPGLGSEFVITVPSM